MVKPWTLTSPSGKTWTGEEPWLLVSRATRERKPRVVIETFDDTDRTHGEPSPAGNSFQEIRRLRTERAGFPRHED